MLNTEKIKIIHNVEYWLPQTMTWLYGQVSNLSEEIFQNIVVCEGSLNTDQFPVKELYTLDKESAVAAFKRRASRKLGIKVELKLLENTIEKVSPQILHSHFGNYGWFNHRVAKRNNLKHVVTFYGVDVNMLPQDPSWKARYIEMFQSIDLCLCEGPYMASCIEKLGCRADKIEVQRLGVNLEKIKFIPRKIKKDEAVKFLIAGTFREKKGIPYALEAIGKIKDKLPKFHITIIGDASRRKLDFFGRSLEEKKRIMETVRKYSLEKNVSFKGFMKHDAMLTEAYNSHIFISPSVIAADGDTEGGAPVGIIEMAASGMPIVSTTHCDIPFVLGDLNRKILAEEKNTDQLADSILQLIHMSESELENMETNNRDFIESNLNVKQCATQLGEKYLRLLKHNS